MFVDGLDGLIYQALDGWSLLYWLRVEANLAVEQHSEI